MSWNKGFTKETHPSIAKISATMKARKIDNFKKWREKMKKIGEIPADYPDIPISGDLAEYIGVTLGDGNISQFPRTERIIIVGNYNNRGFIWRYATLTEKLFKRMPNVKKMFSANAVRISLYQKEISRRLGIPTGDRTNFPYRLPK